MENFKIMQFLGIIQTYLYLALVNLWQVHVKIDKQIGCSIFFLF